MFSLLVKSDIFLLNASLEVSMYFLISSIRLVLGLPYIFVGKISSLIPDQIKNSGAMIKHCWTRIEGKVANHLGPLNFRILNEQSKGPPGNENEHKEHAWLHKQIWNHIEVSGTQTLIRAAL